MGNALRFLYGSCCKPTTTAESGYYDHDHGHSRPTTATASSVSSLTHHLFHFDITLQVPEGLSQHVAASKKAQAIWFRRLVKAWKDSKPPPSTPEQAASLVILTLNSTVQNANIKGLLVFYGLPIPHSLNEIPIEGPALLPEGIEFELRTLPVDAKAIADGDGMTVYVSASDSRESSLLPSHVLEAAVQRSDARAAKHYNKADKLLRTIRDSGYEVLNEEMLVRKYRIRLRGIDAPENEQPCGKEAKQELTRLIGGKSVRILVYEEDQFGRSVGDVYCNGKFVQKAMLKKGLAWHFTRYDKRPELAKWEREAREKRIGLWALSNPEKPWEWRKRNPRKD